jgi:hypothetical protein
MDIRRIMGNFFAVSAATCNLQTLRRCGRRAADRS